MSKEEKEKIETKVNQIAEKYSAYKPGDLRKFAKELEDEIPEFLRLRNYQEMACSFTDVVLDCYDANDPDGFVDFTVQVCWG